MKTLANPLGSIECVAVSMPGVEEGKTVRLSQRDALEYSALGKVSIEESEIEWTDQPDAPVAEEQAAEEEPTDGID